MVDINKLPPGKKKFLLLLKSIKPNPNAPKKIYRKANPEMVKIFDNFALHADFIHEALNIKK